MNSSMGQRGVQQGFTLVEMLVAIMVIGLLTTVSVAQFQSGRQDDALRNAAMRISDALRTAQSAAQSGTLEAYQNAPRYGVYAFQSAVNTSCMSGTTSVNEGLILFADLDNNGLYNSVADSSIKCISFDVDATHTIVLELLQLTKAADNTTTTPTSVSASFQRPAASCTIDGGTVMRKLIFTLKNTRNNHTRQVVLDRISGRIDFEY